MNTYIAQGTEFALGCLPRSVPVGALPLLGEAIAILPRDRWEPRDFSQFVPAVLNQGPHGACVGFGCTQAVKVLRRIAGLRDVDLSPWDLYRRICSGRDAGASIHDALIALRDEGVANATLVPSFTLSRAKPAEWKADAARRKVVEWFDCPSRDALATALQLGFAAPFGVGVTSSWEPDGDGWIAPRGGVRGGHCILGVGLVYRNGQWGVKFVNSWGAAWGLQGFAVYPLDLIDDSFADAWAGRTVTFAEE